MNKTTTTKKKVGASKATATKSSKKSSAKSTGSRVSKPSSNPLKPASATPAKKRTRKSFPLYADIKLSVLRELMGDDDDAVVKVSRNFVLDEKRRKRDAQDAAELGI